MATLRFHFKSILYQNLDVYREPLKVKFDQDPSREVQDFSLKYVDGFTKGLIAQSIVAMADLVEAQLFFGCRCAVITQQAPGSSVCLFLLPRTFPMKTWTRMTWSHCFWAWDFSRPRIITTTPPWSTTLKLCVAQPDLSGGCSDISWSF